MADQRNYRIQYFDSHILMRQIFSYIVELCQQPYLKTQLQNQVKLYLKNLHHAPFSFIYTGNHLRSYIAQLYNPNFRSKDESYFQFRNETPCYFSKENYYASIILSTSYAISDDNIDVV
jgi:hypothetical protein